MTDVCTTGLLPTMLSSNDDSGFRHGFGAEATLALTHNDPAVVKDTTNFVRLSSQWDCHIHADVVRALSWVFSYVFPLV